MLTVTEKIASESDAQAILDASYRLSAPLGVATLIIDPADYQSSILKAPTEDNLEKRVRRKFEEFLIKYGFDQWEGGRFLFHPHKREIEKMTISILKQAIKGEGVTAKSGRYKSPDFCVLICPPIKDASTRILKCGLGMKDKDIPDLPGTDSHWNFIKLWHEFGHAIGPSETHADHISATTFRYVFADTTPLMAFADFRAARAVMFYNDELQLKTCGWPLVNVSDNAIGLEAPATWEQAKQRALTPPLHNDNIADLKNIGRSLCSIVPTAFKARDFSMMGMVCDDLAHKGNVENEAQFKIARRFAIAAQRLSIGREAYIAPPPKPSIA